MNDLEKMKNYLWCKSNCGSNAKLTKKILAASCVGELTAWVLGTSGNAGKKASEKSQLCSANFNVQNKLCKLSRTLPWETKRIIFRKFSVKKN